MKLDISELMRQQTNLTNSQNDMKVLFAKINAELDNVCNNVKSSSLTNANNTLKDNILNISNSIDVQLSKLLDFMNVQLNSYCVTNEEATIALRSLIDTIGGVYGEGGVIASDAAVVIANSNVASSTPVVSSLESQLDAVTGTTVSLPSGYGKTHTYMGWSLIKSKSSDQYKLREAAGENYDSEGFGKIGDRYVVATTTTYGWVGDYIDVKRADGTVLKCIIGDIKNQSDSGCNKWGHDNGSNVIEFIVDRNSWYGNKQTGQSYHSNPGTSSCHPEWSQPIVDITNKGSYWDYN